jgi:hypothetical protein
MRLFSGELGRGLTHRNPLAWIVAHSSVQEENPMTTEAMIKAKQRLNETEPPENTGRKQDGRLREGIGGKSHRASSGFAEPV